MQHLRDHWRASLKFGPALALADSAFEGIEGLPALGAPRLLVLKVVSEAQRDALLDGEGPRFSWSYAGPMSEPLEARIPWDALVGVVGQSGTPGQKVVATRGDLPEWLGPPWRRLDAVRLHLERLGAVPPGPTLPLEWHVGLDGPGEACPDRREAVLALQAREPPFLRVLARADAGLHLEPTPAALGAVAAFAMSTAQIETNGLFLSGPVLGSGGARGWARVPWGALAAVQDPTTRQGWFWGDSLPPPLRDHPALAGAADADLRGLPLAPPEPAPFVVLPGAPELDKRRAVFQCARQGGALLLVDPLAEGARLPGHFGELPAIVVPLAQFADAPPPDPRITGLFVETTTLDFDGVPRRVRLPWNAIFAVAAVHLPRVHSWPADFPPAVQAALRQVEGGEVSAQGEIPVPGFGVRRVDGELTAVVQQPCAPADEEGKVKTRIAEFRLRPDGPAG